MLHGKQKNTLCKKRLSGNQTVKKTKLNRKKQCQANK